MRKAWTFRGRLTLSPLNPMTTYTELKPAIARSQSHNEIVRVEVDDRKEALDSLDNMEGMKELDWSTENDGSLDVWGVYHCQDFRLRISLTSQN